MLLATAFVAMLYSCVREYSVRRYLDGFSDAIVPNARPAEQKVEASLEGVEVKDDENLSLDSEGGAQATTPRTRYLT